GGRDESCGDHTFETRDPISVPPIPNAVPGRYVRSARGVECVLARAPGAMTEKSREISVWLHDDQARLIVGAAPANKSSRWAIRGTIVEQKPKSTSSRSLCCQWMGAGRASLPRSENFRVSGWW